MSKNKIMIAGVWIIFLVLPLSLALRFYFIPKKQQETVRAQQEEGANTVKKTAAAPRFKDKVSLALDSFSGYWALRSPQFADQLSRHGIAITLRDDKANYQSRYRAIQNGEIDVAVFTIGTYIQCAAEFAEANPSAPLDQKLPATIVSLIDESIGDDALVGYKSKFPDMDSINANTKFVLTPNSPSEELMRVFFGYFNLGVLDRNKAILPIPNPSSEEVYKFARVADPKANQVYIVWEPELSKLLQNPNIHILIDSSRFRGYIADVLMVSRKFLLDHRDLAREVLAAHLRITYDNRNQLVQAVKTDAAIFGTILSDKDAARLVKGLWWKTTGDNYAQMGLSSDTNLQNIESIIKQNVDILVRSGSINVDPTEGNYNFLYYPDLLKELKDSNFHPGISTDDNNHIAKNLPPLSDEEWNHLQKIGTLKVDELIFRRGSIELMDAAKESLDKLAESLNAWPTYYLTILGNSAHDPITALDRAKVAEKYLMDKGIDHNRVRALAGTPTGATRVSFVLGQQPY